MTGKSRFTKNENNGARVTKASPADDAAEQLPQPDLNERRLSGKRSDALNGN
jgi:hypothetical protein